MVLTVHDELVFDVRPTPTSRRSSRWSRTAMESAYALSVPLQADLGSGENWADAAPAGH